MYIYRLHEIHVYGVSSLNSVILSSEVLPDEREFVVVTEEEKQEEKEGKPFESHVYIMYIVFPVDHVDLSVRKRKAPDDDDLALQNAAKRAKDSSLIAQEL